MTTLPVWLFAIVVIFAVIGLIDRVFLPGVRWYFRSKANRAIDELNNRLHLRIQPFKLTKRQALVDQLMYDAEIIKAVEETAVATNTPRAVVMAKAAGYAKEIVPHFSSYAYFNIGTRLARWISTLIYRVRMGLAVMGRRFL